MYCVEAATCCGVMEIGGVKQYPKKFEEFLTKAFEYMCDNNGYKNSSFMSQAICYIPQTSPFKVAHERLTHHGWEIHKEDLKRGKWHKSSAPITMYYLDLTPFEKKFKKYVEDWQKKDREGMHIHHIYNWEA